MYTPRVSDVSFSSSKTSVQRSRLKGSSSSVKSFYEIRFSRRDAALPKSKRIRGEGGVQSKTRSPEKEGKGDNDGRVKETILFLVYMPCKIRHLKWCCITGDIWPRVIVHFVRPNRQIKRNYVENYPLAGQTDSA